MLGQIVSILLLVFGFGFVIFWHELGHFLAAKSVGVQVEEFAIGFGPRLLTYLRRGGTARDRRHACADSRPSACVGARP